MLSSTGSSKELPGADCESMEAARRGVSFSSLWQAVRAQHNSNRLRRNGAAFKLEPSSMRQRGKNELAVNLLSLKRYKEAK